MIVNAATLPKAWSGNADVLIVGGGAVGLALAITLARDGRDVLVLEAGSTELRANYRDDNKSVGRGNAHQGRTSGRIRALGGTTRLWGGQLVPFSEQDFQGDLISGRPPWPVRFTELQPFYERALDFLKVSLPLRAAADARRRRLKNDITGYDTIEALVNVWLPTPDFTQLFSSELRSLSGLRIITNAAVDNFRFSPDGSRVDGVTFGSDRCATAPVVVLAAGTLEIVRLLLTTAKVQPSCGFANNPKIGQGFVDHLHGLAGRIEVHDPVRIRSMFDSVHSASGKLSVKLRGSDTFLAQHGLANCAVTLNSSINPRELIGDLTGLLRRLGDGGIRRGFSAARVLIPFAFRYLVKRRSGALLSRDVLLGVEIEQIPSDRSYLYIEDSDNGHGSAFLVGVHWEFGNREVKAAAAVLEEVKILFEKEGLGQITLDPDLVAGNTAFLSKCHDSNHQIGGACMADNAGSGVVDQDLAVFGVHNLYITGAATFPSGSFANPTLTALAFALRLADHLQAKIEL